MTRLPIVGGAVLTALIVIASGTGAAQEPATTCGEMRLTQSAEDIQFIDTGAPGVDAGDRRILRWAVTDTNGQRIGAFFVLTTVLQVTDNGVVAMAEGHVVFADGDIAVSTINSLVNPADTQQSNRTPVTWSINGGTGAFVGANGTLINGPPADNPESTDNWTLEIHMTCAQLSPP